MSLPLFARASARPRAVAALGAAATMAVAAGVAGVSATQARAAVHVPGAMGAAARAQPPALPADVTRAIDHANLTIEMNRGWEAVTGPAARVDAVRVAAAADAVGTLTHYTGDDESGDAILIFTGDDDSPVGFEVRGPRVRSVANNTDQNWRVYDARGTEIAAVPADTSENISPVDLLAYNVPFTINLMPIRFSLL